MTILTSPRIRPANSYVHFQAHLAQVQQKPASNKLHEAPLRYLGFTNEVTHTSRHVQGITKYVPFWNPLGWGTALSYVLTDASLMAKKRRAETGSAKDAAIAFAQGIGFHLVGTLVGPIAVIEPIKHGSLKLYEAFKMKSAKNLSVATGLASIAVIPKILDPLGRKLTGLDEDA